MISVVESVAEAKLVEGGLKCVAIMLIISLNIKISLVEKKTTPKIDLPSSKIPGLTGFSSQFQSHKTETRGSL